MAQRLIWASAAKVDLRALSSYIGQSNPTAARRFVQGVVQAIDRLRDFPLSGRVVPEFNDPGIREVVRKPCRIIYRVRVQESIVEIARIWHASRGIPDI